MRLRAGTDITEQSFEDWTTKSVPNIEPLTHILARLLYESYNFHAAENKLKLPWEFRQGWHYIGGKQKRTLIDAVRTAVLQVCLNIRPKEWEGEK